MTVRIGVMGAGGRMGRAIVRCSRSMDGLAVSAAVDRPGHPDLGQDVGVLAGGAPTGTQLVDTSAALAPVDAVIDFSSPDALAGTLAALAGGRAALVVGITGLQDAHTAALREAAASRAVVWAPNMSLGMNLLFALVRRAAAALDSAYDIEIIEAHHRHKKDAPSGTALRLAECAADGRGVDLRTHADYGRQGLTGERPAGRIGIHAVRGGDIVGDHSVLFAAEGEIVELAHRATNRDTFAMGALTAARWAAAREPGLYGMADVLGIESAGRA